MLRRIRQWWQRQRDAFGYADDPGAYDDAVPLRPDPRVQPQQLIPVMMLPGEVYAIISFLDGDAEEALTYLQDEGRLLRQRLLQTRDAYGDDVVTSMDEWLRNL